MCLHTAGKSMQVIASLEGGDDSALGADLRLLAESPRDPGVIIVYQVELRHVIRLVGVESCGVLSSSAVTW